TVRHWNEVRAERAHPLEFRFGSSFNHDDGTRHTCLSCRISRALSCVSRADGPYAAFAFGLRQHRHRVRCAAQFVGIDWLQVLQLQADVRLIRPYFETD